MNKALLLGLFAVSLSAQAEWEFRGTPNDWATTALDHVSGSEYQTCQTFGSNNPRFKIDRYGNWNEAYPSADYSVSAGSYLITFNSDSKHIDPQPVSSCSSNQAPSAVISPANAQTVDAGTTITFSGSGSSDADGSVVAYDWSTGETTESISVTFTQSQLITLKVTDDQGATSALTSVDITVAGEQEAVWCFRGTANGWGQTALALNSDSGLYELNQKFAGEESPARFKVAACSEDGSWGENYPNQDFSVLDNTNYKITFNASSHEITATEIVTPEKPELDISPNSSDFDTDSLNVTLSYNGENITDSRYLLGAGDVTQGTVFSNGDVISIGADLQIGQSVDLQVFALNAQGSVAQTYTYTKVEAPETGFVVCVVGLNEPTIHHWNALPEGSTADSAWPGDTMTEIADGLYSYRFVDSISSSLLFSESGNNKTPDLTRSSDGTYYVATASWEDGCKVPVEDADVSIDPANATFSTDDLTVTLHATGDDVTGGRYTIDGSDPVNGLTFNDGATIVVGAELAIDQSMQVCLWAANSDSHANECFTLTKVAPPTASDFTWDNASVYFVITDRFKDGNSANNNSYGRPSVDATGKNIGTFHGGDIAGLTEKLNSGYFTDLGINAIWLTAPYEQAHGFVGGGDDGDFAHYAYHGYYVQDYTNLDKNMGTPAEFKQFVDTAHSQGIRVVMDVVMNHAGYNTLKDMHEFNYGSTTAGEYWTPGPGQNWFAYHDTINYAGDEYKWLNWWGKDWVRVGLPGYDACGPDGDDLTKCLAYLPDFKTESTQNVGIPPFLANKATFGQGYLTNYQAQGTKRVRDWITEWLVKYVEDYGIDGFRVDTAKHVTYDNWSNLKYQANIALQEWRQKNPGLPGADWNDDFWATAEVWGHGVGQSDIHTTANFDSVINFSFKGTVDGMVNSADEMLNQFASYAGQVNQSTDWNVLSYISSHDTGAVFYNNDDTRQKRAGTALLLLPGGVQIFYGDELGRKNGDGGSDADQGSRSSVDWSKENNAVHQHWQKVGQFRRDNPAVGAGQHTNLSGQSSGKAFARSWTNPVSGIVNNVVVVLDGNGQVSVNVSGYFANGVNVRNAYDGTIATVSDGKVNFNAGTEGLILIEAM